MIVEIELRMYFNGLSNKRHFRSSNSLPAEYSAISKLHPYNSGYVATRLPGYVEYPAASKLLPLALPRSRIPRWRLVLQTEMSGKYKI